jgi:O-acetyl-ADP-ribose deacetylase (regulator of RNase III)
MFKMTSNLEVRSVSSLAGSGSLTAILGKALGHSGPASKVYVLKADITTLPVDVIVNAANSGLLGGGGVDGVIHRAAGPELMKECRTLNGCQTGSAKITDAYKLPSKKVIHAVGPNCNYERNMNHAVAMLKGCYDTSLELAAENDCKSIAFSSISTGIYAFPKRKACTIASQAVKSFLEGEHGSKIDVVVFCCFSDQDRELYETVAP